MLLLTILMAVTTHQVTQNWEKAGQQLTLKIVQKQFLNNLYWQLRQVGLLVQYQQTKDAQTQWQTLRQTVTTIDQTNNGLSVPKELTQFLANDSNLYHIPEILQRHLLDFSIYDLQQALTDLQAQSHRTTLIVSATMVLLGLLLMGITSKDLITLFNALNQSRNLNNHIQESERQRIAHDLHDGVIQELIVLKRQYDPERLEALIDTIRRICQNLNPRILEDLGLVPGLTQLTDDLSQALDHPVTLTLNDNLGATVPPAYHLPLFRITQELLTNVKRHAQATKASLTIVYDPEESPMLRLYVKDNGSGFDPNQPAINHLGLTGVRQRVEQLGGKLLIQSAPNGQGSLVQVVIPIAKEAIHAA